MNCPVRDSENTELLLDYCFGKLSSETTKELESHIEHCSDCHAFANAQQQVWASLDDWDAEPVSANFDRRLHERIAQEEERPSWQRWFADRSDWRPALSIGAACATLALALFVNAPTGKDTVRNQPGPAPVVIENTRIDSIEPEQVERALEDLEMLKQLSTSTTQDI